MREVIFQSDITAVLIDAVPFLVVDLETGEILYASRPFERMLKYTVRGELVGMNVDDLVPEELQPRHIEYRDSYAANPIDRAMGPSPVLAGRCRDGSKVALEIGLYPCVLSRRRCVLAVALALPKRQSAVGEQESKAT